MSPRGNTSQTARQDRGRHTQAAPAMRGGLSSPIKWPGGKAQEYPFIQHVIPRFNRYVEPFFGGGAIYFMLQPQKALINDFSGDLMDFYRFLKGDYKTAEFADELYDYVTNWENIGRYIDLFENELGAAYQAMRHGELTKPALKQFIMEAMERRKNDFDGLFSTAFCIDSANLEAQIVNNLVSKLTRTMAVEAKHGTFSAADVQKNIETAFRSGFYMHFRDLMNNKLGKGEVSAAKYTANYYFIREFCYGAMFRYNASGQFNIPYGGMAYNNKDFRKKADYILSPAVRQALRGATIENGDFAEVLAKHETGAGDFIFLDPPYDSDFSDYDNNGFGMDDHKRLAEFMYHTKAQCMLLIKETPFIRSLYDGKPGITIESFDKRYLYNVKGRNNQAANHLIIYNYSL